MGKKIKDRFEGLLPDGSFTRSTSRYIAAWHEVARPLCDELGWRLQGFDPGFSFAVGRDHGPIAPGETPSGCAYMHRSLVQRLGKLVQEARAARKILAGQVGSASSGFFRGLHNMSSSQARSRTRAVKKG